MEELLKKAKKHLTTALVFHTDIIVKKALGLEVEGSDGKKYMDFTSGLATTNIGHSHPAVVKAVKTQIERLMHTGCIYYSDSTVELAEKLSTITPGNIDTFFFSNSGAEAVEGALKLARFVTRRQGIVAFTGGFHGRTFGAMTLTASTSKYRKHYHPLLPSVFHVPYPNCYRCSMGNDPDTCSTECFGYLDNLFQYIVTPEEVACVIIEPVLGEGGYVPAPAGYLQKLRKLCTAHGIMFIADEVQTGFGRTGKWFASEHHGIKPDIITIAKGIASGLPLSAVGSTSRIMSKWSPGAHGTTFGGNPAACAASLATIKTIENEGLLENAREVGAFALERLDDMWGKYPSIGDVRGAGLMIGIEFINQDGSPDAEIIKKILKEAEVRGLIIVECGVEKNVVRLMPPLITTKADMAKALKILDEAVSAATAG